MGIERGGPHKPEIELRNGSQDMHYMQVHGACNAGVDLRPDELRIVPGAAACAGVSLLVKC